MIKPQRLQKGDKIAVVSLSSGMLGDDNFIHKYYIAKERLEKEFGLEVIAMPNALKGSEFVYKHPEERAKDLMAAFKDKSIKGIFCAIGGDDTVRLLPYIDYAVIKNNPKIFMGYSDTTVNHLMMNKAGIVSFYGPCIMCEFGEYVKMFDYTKNAVQNILFKDCQNYEIKSSKIWSNDFIAWQEENINVEKKTRSEEHGYEVLQGSGIVTGELLGGCLDVFPMVVGTEIWPTKEEWQDKILLLETSEDKPSPEYITFYLRNLGALGIFDVINEQYYEEYKEVYQKILKEFNKEDLPVLYNVNIGHSDPIGILPLGSTIKVDYTNKKIYLVDSPCL